MKKLTFGILGLVMMLSLVPMIGSTADADAESYVCYIDVNSNNTFDDGDVKYETITDALTKVEKPSTETEEQPTVIRMLADSTENITIAKDRYITLDLDGWVLCGKKASEAVITVKQDSDVYGWLTVEDSNIGSQTHNFKVAENGLWTLTSDDATVNFEDLTARPSTGDVVAVTGGCITGGISDTSGAGISNWGTLNFKSGNVVGNTVESNGGGIWSQYEANISGGNIMGNTAGYDGGGIYTRGSIFNISGGNILYNTANNNGGGVCHTSEELNISGGYISGNRAGEKGGGVYNMEAEFNLYGGKISENSAVTAGGGIYYESYYFEATDDQPSEFSGYMTMGGTAVVEDNVLTNDTTSNLYIYDNNLQTNKECSVNIETGENVPAEGMSIGVTLGTANGMGQFTSNGTANDKQYFTSDNASYGVAYNKEGSYLELVDTPEAVESAEYSAFLILDESIDLDLEVSSLGSSFSQNLLIITVDGSEIKSGDITYEDNTISCVLKEVEPKEIGTSYHIVITYDGVQVTNFTYSVKDYCEAAFAAYENDKPTYANVNTLCEALLNYGKYAEDYANGDTASTLNSGHEVNFGKDYKWGTIIGGNVTDGAGSASLDLGSTIKLNYYVNTTKKLTNEKEATQNFYLLTDDPEKKADYVQIDPKRVTVTPNGTNKYIVSVDLYASQLADSYTLKLKGVDTSKFEIAYGVYNYCNDVQDETGAEFTDTLKTLCKAIHNYGQAVKAYTSN